MPAGRGVLLLLGLWLRFLSPPGKEVLPGEEPERTPKASVFLELGPPEEAEIPGASEYRGPFWKETPALVNPEDALEPAQDEEGEGERMSPLLSKSILQPWPHGDLEEPVCSVKLDRGNLWGQNHLEVMGLLTSYDSRFLKALSKSAWTERELRTFGMCPTAVPPGLLASLQQVADQLANPGDHHFLLLHLEEVKWEAETKLRFKLTFQEDVMAPLGPLQLALLIFYQGGKALEDASPQEAFLVSGTGLHQDQIVCLSRETQFLVLQGSVTSGRHSPGQLSFGASLAVRHHSSKERPEAGSSTGTSLSTGETQALLFGFDSKCFTHMTPAVLLLAKANPPSSFLAADRRLEVAPYLSPSGFSAPEVANLPPADATAGRGNLSALAPASTGQFLKVLSEFVNKVLSASGEAPPAPRPQLRLDSERLEELPHSVLNLSEQVALEQLVRSEDHLVVLFPKDRPPLPEPPLSPSALEGPLLQLLLQRLRSLVRQLKAIPEFQANAPLFQRLVAFCYYPANLHEGGLGRAEGAGAREKIHSLLLLKALQTVRARWQDSQKASSRANRSARHRGDYCRLRELTIDLRSMEYIIFPESYTANNCVGSCRGPLSTRIPDFYSHTLFLLRVLEQGLPLERTPCCVPVKYSQSLFFTFTSDQGMKIKVYPDMVAETCGCR